MPFVNIHMSKSCKILHGWCIHPIFYEMTIKEYFTKLKLQEISPEYKFNIADTDVIEHVKLLQTIHSETLSARLDCNIIELTQTFNLNICYQLKSINIYSIGFNHKTLQ